MQCNNLTVSVWQDKPVIIAATNSDLTQELRKQWDGSSIPFKSPQSVVLYNKNMGGVDNNNQLRGYYHVRQVPQIFTNTYFGFCLMLQSSPASFCASILLTLVSMMF